MARVGPPDIPAFTVIWIAKNEKDEPKLVRSVHPVYADKAKDAVMKFLRQERIIGDEDSMYPGGGPDPDSLFLAIAPGGTTMAYNLVPPTMEWDLKVVG